MSVTLPTTVNYADKLASLPDATQSIGIASAPVNGQTFTAGQIINFDLLNRGFLVPDSMYLSYTYTSANAAAVQLIGCPGYTSFSRAEVQVGSVTIESINNYNVLMHFLTNTTLDIAQKYGLQSAYGYASNATQTSIEVLDGRLVGAGEVGSFSVPLMTVLSNAEKLIPLFAMPQIRINLTVESINNMFNSTVTIPTAWTLSNLELRYKIVDMGGQVEDIVRGMGDKIYIKSQSFATSTASSPLASGYNEFVYNQRFASVKSLFGLNGNTSTNSNRIFDSVDVTRNTGDYCFNLAGVNYPQKVISSRVNKSQALQELRSAMGSVFDRNNNFAINSLEFLANDDTVCLYTSPGKFYIGTSCERLNSNSLLTGVSTQNSPISYKINSGQQVVGTTPFTLIVNYDALFEVDTVNRQVSLKC
jgi:hypothetical protein